MNTKYLLTASLTGGLISIVLVNTPYLGLINLLLCVGFWAGPIVAVWLYRRQDGAVTLSQAMLTGMLAGVWHGLFGVLLSPLGLAGAGGVFRDVQQIVSAQDLPELESALTGVGGILFNLAGVAVDIAFGFIGGLIGGVFLGPRRAAA